MERNALYYEIMHLVDAYNRNEMEKEDYMSPFIARHWGQLDVIAKKIGEVSVKELDAFLTEVNKDLPPIGE